jgi:hypothetical protein
MAQKIFEAARALADELRADIELCSTRAEHVRVTARANAAAELVEMLNRFDDDLK